jgi:tetratricopeptide (TPR) repeat protein
MLRTAKALAEADLSARRMWRALRSVRDQLPSNRPLSSVRVLAEDDRVVVREQNLTWEPESGQTILDFSVEELAEKVAPLVYAAAQEAKANASTAEEWFELGLEFDQVGAHDDACGAYREALALDGQHVNARINLGRLLHHDRAYRQAEELYREALKIEPMSVIAAFNLGVVLEDQGAIEAAIDAYQRALSIDPGVADVHYNLARLYEHHGDEQAAARHFARFNALAGRREE